MDGCALSAPSCTTRGARRPRAPPSACYHRHRKLMRRVDAPTITTTASRRRRHHDDAIFPKLKFLRDAESAREQEPDRHEELVVPLDLGAPAEFVLRQHGLDGRGLGLAAPLRPRRRRRLAFACANRRVASMAWRATEGEPASRVDGVEGDGRRRDDLRTCACATSAPGPAS